MLSLHVCFVRILVSSKTVTALSKCTRFIDGTFSWRGGSDSSVVSPPGINLITEMHVCYLHKRVYMQFDLDSEKEEH